MQSVLLNCAVLGSQEILEQASFWKTLGILVKMFEPIVRALRIFESDGIVKLKRADGVVVDVPVLSSMVAPALLRLKDDVLAATPPVWQEQARLAIDTVMGKIVTVEHVR